MSEAIVPLRENRSIKFGTAAPVIDLSGASLPTKTPIGKYIASLESMSSRRTMQRILAGALCVMEEGRQLGEVDAETSLFYHQHIWLEKWETTSREWMVALVRRTQTVGYSPSTRRMTISAIRGVLKECRIVGLMGAEAYFQATENLPKIRNSRPPKGRTVAMEEILELLRACDADENRAKGVRDAAIITLGWSCGLRAMEVVGLTTSDYSRQAGTLLVNGKGGKRANVPVPKFAQERLDNWLELRGSTPGRIFTQVDLAGNVLIRSLKTGERRLKPLTRPDSVNRILVRRIGQAKLMEPFSFHDLRRTAATELSREFGIEIARELLRHVSIETTARYRMLDQSELREAVAVRDERLRQAVAASGSDNGRAHD